MTTGTCNMCGHDGKLLADEDEDNPENITWYCPHCGSEDVVPDRE